MKCKNCGHKIVQLFGEKWYHVSPMPMGKDLPVGGECPKHKSNGSLCGCKRPTPKKRKIK